MNQEKKVKRQTASQTFFFSTFKFMPSYLRGWSEGHSIKTLERSGEVEYIFFLDPNFM